MKIICIADSHNKHSQIDIPKGDIIIHAGDFTEAGTKFETKDFLSWFSNLPHQHKILVAGNHDFYLEKNDHQLKEIIPSNVHYLKDRGISIENINFWGAPYTPGNGNWAFNISSKNEILKHWKMIPENTDFLITHSPPYGILDELDNKSHIGCDKLLERVKQLKIPYHIFGHNHNDYGIEKKGNSIFINAASLDQRYRPINSPLVIHYKTS